jgi:PQQ-like domain
VPVLMSPGGNGGVNWAPMSYSPRTGYFYVTAADRPASRNAPGSGKILPPALGAKYSGTLTAVDARTNRIAWQKKTPYSIGQGSGALTTASDVLFHGEPDGNFQAYDAKTGELLWQWQTGAGADAPAITYEIDGEQYVAIAVGGLSIQTASANGDMIWVFSLKGNPRHPIAQFAAPNPPPKEVSFNFTGLLKGEVPIVNTNAVKMIDYAFNPSRITVSAGTTVTFTNQGSQLHNAAGADAGGWDIVNKLRSGWRSLLGPEIRCNDGLCRTGQNGSSDSSFCRRPSLRPVRLMSPEAPGEPTGAFIDAALALDEPVQRLGIRLVGRRVAHDAAPLTPRPLVSFGRISGAPDDSGEGIFTLRYFQPT